MRGEGGTGDIITPLTNQLQCRCDQLAFLIDYALYINDVQLNALLPHHLFA